MSLQKQSNSKLSDRIECVVLTINEKRLDIYPNNAL